MPRIAVAIVLAAAILPLAACTPTRMAGFDAIAAGPGMARVDVTGVPGWMNGSFRLGEATGSVRRVVASDAFGWGPDEPGAPADLVRVGAVARGGTLAFTVAPPGLAGPLEGHCRYMRSEARDRVLGADVSAPLAPLTLACRYRIGGSDAGGMDLAARPGRGFADGRAGRVVVDGGALAVTSAHAVEGTSLTMGAASGYTLADTAGRPAGALDYAGFRNRRLIVPTDPALRPAAYAALVTLALFIDPADVD